MTKKVKLAVIDDDLKIRTMKSYDVSKAGNKISVVSGGEGHFMPSFDNHSFLEFPRPRWKGGGWERIYFSKRLAKKCVNFKTEKMTGPDPEDMKKAVSSTLLEKLGKDDPPFPTWIIYIILAVSVMTFLKLFGVLV